MRGQLLLFFVMVAWLAGIPSVASARHPRTLFRARLSTGAQPDLQRTFNRYHLLLFRRKGAMVFGSAETRWLRAAKQDATLRTIEVISMEELIGSDLLRVLGPRAIQRVSQALSEDARLDVPLPFFLTTSSHDAAFLDRLKNTGCTLSASPGRVMLVHVSVGNLPRVAEFPEVLRLESPDTSSPMNSSSPKKQ